MFPIIVEPVAYDVGDDFVERQRQLERRIVGETGLGAESLEQIHEAPDFGRVILQGQCERGGHGHR